MKERQTIGPNEKRDRQIRVMNEKIDRQRDDRAKQKRDRQ